MQRLFFKLRVVTLALLPTVVRDVIVKTVSSGRAVRVLFFFNNSSLVDDAIHEHVAPVQLLQPLQL